MKSRRQEDFAMESRSRDSRIRSGQEEPYSPNYNHGRSLSPRSRVMMGGNRRSISLERRRYKNWGDQRVERARSRSPSFGQVDGRAQHDMGFSSRDELQRRHEFHEHMDVNADVDPRSRRVMGGDRRSSSLERRQYSYLGDGRAERIRSRSPPYGQMHKRAHYDAAFSSRDELWRRREFPEHIDVNADVDAGLKHEYGYEYAASSHRDVREKDVGGGRHLGSDRMLDPGVHGKVGQKSMVFEGNIGRGMHSLHADSGPTLDYVEDGGNFASTLGNMELSRFKDERVRYPDPFLRKLSAAESYGKGENPIFHPRNVSYSLETASQTKDFMVPPQFKDLVNTSSGISRANFPVSYRGDMPSPAGEFATHEYPRSSVKVTEPLVLSGYGKRHIEDTGGDLETEHKDAAYYWQDTNSPTGAERQVHLYPRPGARESDDFGYQSDELRRRMALHEPIDYEHRDLPRSYKRDLVKERAECSQRNQGDSNSWDHPSLQKQTVSDYIMSRSSAVPKQDARYFDYRSSNFENERKATREQEIRDSCVSWDHDIPHARVDYGFRGDGGPVSHKETMRNSPDFHYESQRHKFEIRTQGMQADEPGINYPSDRVLTRKYGMVEEMNRHNSRSLMSSKWNNSSRTEDLNDRGEEWIGDHMSGSCLSKSMGHHDGIDRMRKRAFDGTDSHRVSSSQDWLMSPDPVEHVPEHSRKPYKSRGKYLKSYPRPGSLGWYNSSHGSRSHVLPKQRNAWVRGIDDNQVDVHANEVERAEDLANSVKSEPHEDSEEFKQLINTFFLSFTRKLNDNPGVQKRYKEQGRAGSLFCIVCGRSLSKEFIDTRSLAAHAFMSPKGGLKARHLGLHKAICVLMGWNCVAPETTTWFPVALSSSEALSQKEDLILWPPVIVIHNSSISDNNQEGLKVITVEALGEFLRGKGFSGGKIKVCLGKPSNHSIMVVKFLGTFPGLQDAEKLHKYFAENKRGRRDFERISSGGNSSNKGGGMQGDKVEEVVLYGYMGIAEDLDKVDFDIKRKCSIKSKKEIQDLANAPLKPE